MRRGKLNLGANDFATFAARSDQDTLLSDLLSTYTPRSLSDVVHFMMLLPKRRAWIGLPLWYHQISVAPFVSF